MGKKPDAAGAKSGAKIIAQNKRARFDYHIIETVEAGIVLSGAEIKSVRNGDISLAQSFVQAYGDELYLVGAHIRQYSFNTATDYDPVRKRKLLMSRHEIDRFISRISAKGFTAVPLDVHLRNGRAKVEIALAKGKDAPDKRDSIKARESKREMDRATKQR